MNIGFILLVRSIKIIKYKIGLVMVS